MPRSRKSEEETETVELDENTGVAGVVELDGDEPLGAPVDEDDEEPEDLDVPATAAGKASAVRLIEFLVERKVLALHVKKPGADLIEGIARVLESPLPLKARALRLSDAIVDAEDTDELFVDDETLIELLKRW